MAALCRAFGISRQTGYKWLRRFAEVGELAKLTEHSRRPKSHPRRTPTKMQRIVIQARRQHPHWGPRKLRAWLKRRGVDAPAASTIGEILKQAGLVAPRRRRRRATPSTQPFGECSAPNQVWCIDFKGEFRTDDGEWCIPLTVTDAFSRFILCCVAVAAPDTATVRRILTRIFREFGLPDAFRSDNGPPFASTGAAGPKDAPLAQPNPITGTGDTRTVELGSRRRGSPASKRAAGGQERAFTVTGGSR